jgi:magnesium chelatase family protein
MMGPPGAGKTLIARALPGIMPDLTIDEALEVTRIYSVADLLPNNTPMIRQRPFRAPYHTISHASGTLTFPANFMLIAAMNPCPQR